MRLDVYSDEFEAMKDDLSFLNKSFDTLQEICQTCRYK